MTPFLAFVLCAASLAQDATTLDRTLRTLAIYDVRDLVSDVTGSVAPNGPSIEDLATLLRDTVLKGDEVEIRVQSAAGSLVVVASPEAHRLLTETLMDFRKPATSAYEIDIRLVRANPGDVGAAESGAAVVEGSLDDEIERFVGRGDVLAAPRIVTRPLQRAKLSVLDQVKFVKGYAVIPDLDGFDGPLTVPEIGQFDSGVVVDILVSPTPGDPSGVVRVDLAALVGEIERPIAIEASEHGPVHKPVTTTREVRTVVSVPLGKVVRLVSAPAEDKRSTGTGTGAGDEAVILYLEVRRVE